MTTEHANKIATPEPCRSCDEYYEYADGLCWECYHEDQELLRRENMEAEQEFKADQKQFAKECR